MHGTFHLTASRVKPTHYDISLFNLQLSGSWGYDGKVKIDTKIVEPTSEVVLNVKAVEVQGAEIALKDGKSAIQAKYNSRNQGRLLTVWSLGHRFEIAQVLGHFVRQDIGTGYNQVP